MPEKTYPVGIVGESNYQEAIRRCRVGEPVRIVHERGNPYSKSDQALAVRDARGETIGYIPEEHWLKRAVFKEGCGLEAQIRDISDGARGRQWGVTLNVGLADGPIAVRDYADAQKAAMRASLKELARGQGSLSGQTVLFSGAFHGTHDDYADFAALRGADIATGLSKEVTILVVPDYYLEAGWIPANSEQQGVAALMGDGTAIRVLGEAEFLASLETTHDKPKAEQTSARPLQAPNPPAPATPAPAAASTGLGAFFIALVVAAMIVLWLVQ